MATINKKNTTASLSNAVNYQGAPAEIPTDAYKRLLRQACSCMLFEPTYYASGTEIAKEIAETAALLDPKAIVNVALHIQQNFKLRSISTFLLACAIKKRNASWKHPNGTFEYNALSACIENAAQIILQRPDMLTELFAQFQYVAGADTTFPKVLLRIAQKRMNAYSPYQIGKYSQRGGVTLKDVLRIAHPKPKDDERANLFKSLKDGSIEVPETWEKRLSAGQDKASVWSDMLREGTLGGIAILKNLRNMIAANVDPELIRQGLQKKELFRGALLTQIFAANKHSNSIFQSDLEALIGVADLEPLPGKTIFLVDVSGSMDVGLSGGEIRRIDAACFLAAVGSGLCEQSEVFSFSDNLVGVALRSQYPFQFAEAISSSQRHNGTDLAQALKLAYKNVSFDRIIVITDEQANSMIPAAITKKSYIINVAPYKAGIQQSLGYHRIDGFSPRVLQFIAQYEGLEGNS